MSTILPTHTCFDDALDFVEERVLADPALARGESLLVVHAIALAPEGPRKGEPFAHAWVEELVEGEWLVWQLGWLGGEQVAYSMPRDEHHRHLQVVDETRYTLRQVHAENCRHGTYGPWEERYQALCRERGEEPVMYVDARHPADRRERRVSDHCKCGELEFPERWRLKLNAERYHTIHNCGPWESATFLVDDMGPRVSLELPGGAFRVVPADLPTEGGGES